MSYINKSETLQQLQSLVKQNIHYMSDDFNEKQRDALELFQKRIFLEEIIEQSIAFNKKLTFDNTNDKLQLVKTAEELIEVFKLRSDMFHKVGYQNEFIDTIEGLNFDIYDKNSAIIYYKNYQEITGTVRLIYDSESKLPSESVMSFNQLREENNTIVELSRNTIKHKTNGLGLEFKHLMCGVYNVFTNNDINLTLSAIKKEHYKLCSKFGGIEVLDEVSSYGTLQQASLLISWDLSKISPFFKKAFLK